MKEIMVRRMLDFTPSDFTNKLKSPVSVTYEDGISVVHTAHEMAVNRYVYSLIDLFPKLKIKSVYSIHNYYAGGEYVAKTINLAFEEILSDIIDLYVNVVGSRLCLESVYEKMYLILEGIYNNIICENLKYVASLSIKDFLEIQLKPELMEAIDLVRTEKTREAVLNTYSVLDNVIRNSPELKHNPIARGYVSGTIATNQVKQLLASRGFITEIDSSIFKYPIASSFVLGMDDMYDMAVESRSGAKALYLSNRAISMSEYFAREMQLTTMGVERLVDGDCGNIATVQWTVTDKDFNNLLGKHYFVDGVERVISKNSRGIIGTTINIRSLISCKLPNKREVCSACFGRLSNNVPLHSNLGHITLTVLSAIITQLILSTKHVITSASADAVVMTDIMRSFFVIKNKDTYAFRANSITKKKYTYYLHLPQEQAFGITDIVQAADVRKLNIGRISKLEVIHISMEDDAGNVIEHPLNIRQGSRYGNLTYEFLEYIKEFGYSLDNNDRYVIDLTNWKAGIPVISLPQVEFSYIDLAKAIKEEFKSMRSTTGTPEAFLHKIFDLVNNKLSINIALLEVIIYAFTVVDPDNGNYDLGRNSPNARQVKMLSIMSNRSVGGGYAWEYVMDILLSPKSFYGSNAVDHPLDVMLMPNEVISDYYGKL